MINRQLIFLLRQKWKKCLLFLQFDKMVCRFLCFKVTENLLKIWVVFWIYFPVNMFLFKSLPQELFCSEDANSHKFILCCYRAPGHSKISSRSPKTKQSKNKGDPEQASNSECTEEKWWFSNLLSDDSQICLKISKITSTNLTIWNDRTCRWTQIRRICS